MHAETERYRFKPYLTALFVLGLILLIATPSIAYGALPAATGDPVAHGLLPPDMRASLFELPTERVDDIAFEGSVLWAATTGGELRLDMTDHTYVFYNEDAHLTSVAITPIGIKWFGNYLDGAASYDGSTWTTYNTGDGLVANSVLDVSLDADGNPWFATSGGVSHFDGTTWTSYSDAFSDSYVLASFIAGANDLWFGTWNGAIHFDGTTWTTYTTAHGLASDYIQAIDGDAAGNVWFGTNAGVTHFDGTTWTSYTTADGLVSDSVLAVALAPDGSVWFGTDGGASRFDGSTWTTFTSVNGLPDGWIRAIAVHPAGGVWFGGDGGLGTLSGPGTTWPAVTGITPDSALASDILHITQLTGADFQAGATVKLSRPGYADIPATNVVVVDATTLTCDLDLTGAAPGLWDVVVTNPDGASGRLSGGFRVTDGNSYIYLPALMRNFPVIPDTPDLNTIDNADGDGTYTLSWSASEGASTYTLQEEDDATFSSPTTLYSGSDTSVNITGRDIGTYAYRVKASNPYAESDWSNIEWVEVTEPLSTEPLPRIAYHDITNEDLRYAYFDGTEWQVETVDSVGTVGEYASLAIDAHGRPYIAYYDATNADLKVAHHNGVQWQISTVDATGDVGEYASLSLDSLGRPYVAYRDSTNNLLKVAHHDGASWQVAPVPSATGGYHASLALDTEDHPHIAYVYQGLNYVGVRYAYHDGAAWDITKVADGDYTSLALDADGYPHISYAKGRYEANQQGYAYLSDTGWKYLSVPLDTNIVEDYRENSIGLDSDGRPYIIYHAHPQVTTNPWSRLGYVGGHITWREDVERVSTSRKLYVGQYNSLAMDAEDRPHIAYTVGTTLKYGYRDGATWTIVQTFEEVSHHSLALDE